jgi:hypothetical protein
MKDNIYLDDPNAGLFGGDEEDLSDEEFIQKQLYDKNPKRVSAFGDLVYNALMKEIDSQDIPEDAKRKLLFSLTANSILDMICDADQELAIEATLSFDVFIGVSLTNKKFKVDLFKELTKALMDIKEDEFPTEEAYGDALAAFEEQWWDIPQPLLDQRTPNDAIIEVLSKYGLTE